MSKEKKMLYCVETTQIIDPTKVIGCNHCAFNYRCKYYHTICDLQKNNVHFGVRLLCTLLKVDRLCTSIFNDHLNTTGLFSVAVTQETLELFLPAVNNSLKAFYKYDFETCPDWAKVTVITILANTLKKWDCLEDFDFMFSQDVEETVKQLMKK